MFGSLRDYMDRLKELGLLVNYPEEVHWNLEAPALCAMTNRTGGPAL